MSRTPLVIIGAGGFGREVHDVVEAVNDDLGTHAGFDVIGFLDDTACTDDLVSDRGLSVLGPAHRLEDLPGDVQYVIGIGSGAVRRGIDVRASAGGRVAAQLVHPAAVLGRHRVTLAPGSIVCASAVITTNVRLGRHVHVNIGATVGHDAVLENYVTLNPNVSVSGGAVLGEAVSMGTGSSVLQYRRVGAGTTVGAGAVVARDLPADVVAVGVPARVREA
ncbi:acetyltransferase [Blastococcus capsensis]|uniref:acetyltransferase n=1 Tax=Blastococcus capsensis TaxID=1564163 RepID=UPI002541957C|nr:acetyltransferase [Blastococcus capsensis]MDK3257136.1 acetyltransferase [Blastococcus capsensis]